LDLFSESKCTQTNRDTATVVASITYAQRSGKINKLKTLHETYLRIKELPHYFQRLLLRDKSLPIKQTKQERIKKTVNIGDIPSDLSEFSFIQ